MFNSLGTARCKFLQYSFFFLISVYWHFDSLSYGKLYWRAYCVTSVQSEKNKAKDIVYILHLNNSWLGDNSINYSLAGEQAR